MADSFDLKVQGVDDLKRVLAELPARLRKKVLVRALRAGGKVVLTEARARVPVLSSVSALSTPYRKPGTVKKALSVRASKHSLREGNVGVFVNVKPASGTKYRTERASVFGLKLSRRVVTRASRRGTKSRDDPYYWRWLEFGTARMQAIPFLKPAAEKLPQALSAFESEAIPAINALNKRA